MARVFIKIESIHRVIAVIKNKIEDKWYV